MRVRMVMYTDRDRVIALAGVFQAGWLTQQLARSGSVDESVYRTSIESIFRLDVDETAAVFGDVGGVTTGLELLRDKLDDRAGARGMELARYVLTLAQLERKLHANPTMLARLGEGIDTIRAQMEYFRKSSGEEGPHPTVIRNLAELYTETLSSLSPRVLVNGEHEYLTNTTIVNRIRAALLAGVRSAVLWNQVGGRRWHLLFLRRRYVRAAREVLAAEEIA